MKFLLNYYRRHRLFANVVVAPVLLSVVYFGLIASDVYISESRFVIRSPERQTSSPFGAILKGSGFSRAEEDALIVQSFVLSRDALRALEKDVGFSNVVSNKSIDIFSRFPGVFGQNGFEELYLFYKQHIDIKMDSASSIVSLSVRSFDAESAQKINLKLLTLAEGLVNQLNERARQDMIRFAVNEAIEQEKKAKVAALALARFRNDKGVIDPERQSTIPLQQIARLQEELVGARTQIVQLQKLAKDNPQLSVLEQKATLLEQEIHVANLRVAGAGDRSLAGKAAEFQRLVLEKEFADKMLSSAMSALEHARNEAQRQQLYLERIVQPSEPDKALEPRRIRSIFAGLMLFFMCFGILKMLIAGVREHQE